MMASPPAAVCGVSSSASKTAHERRAAGANVVVACIEPVEGGTSDFGEMPMLPVLPTPYGHDGLDLEAIRRLHPDVVVVDDLVRLTPEHAERIPNVDALRLLASTSSAHCAPLTSRRWRTA